MADNYVAIRVKATDEAKPDLTDLRTRLEELKGQVARARAEVDDADADAKLAALEAKLAAVDKRVVSPRIDMAGASRAVAQVAQVESSLSHLKDDAGKDGQDSGQSFAQGFIGFVKPPMSKPALISGGILAGLAALPGVAGVAGVATGAALLGGMTKTIASGAYSQVSGALKAWNTAQSTTGKAQASAMKSYQAQMAALTPVQQQFATSLESVQGAWGNFVAANTSGVQQLLSQGMGLLPKVLGNMSSLFGQIVPQFGSIVANLNPVIDGLFGVMRAAVPAFAPFVNAILGLVHGILPGLQTIIQATVPIIGMFGGIMSKLGTQIGGLFSSMAPAVSAGMKIFGAILGLLGALLPIIGQLASQLAGALGPVLSSFGQALVALTPAISTIGRVLGALAGAILSSLTGALSAVAQILQGVAPAFGVLASTLAQVFNVMENAGVFGVLENTLEALAGPIGTLIGELVSGLAPVLGQVLTIVATLATNIGSALVSAVLQIIQAFSAQDIATFAQSLGDIVTVAGQLVTILTPALAAVIQAVATALAAIISAIPPDVLAAIAVGVGAVVLGIRAWALAQAALAVIMAASGWGLLLAAIAAIVVAVIACYEHFQVFRSAMNAIGRWFAGPFVDAFKDVGKFFTTDLPRYFSDAVHAVEGVVKGWYPVILGILSGGVLLVPALIYKYWSQITRYISQAWNDAIGWLEGVPGKIIGVFANAGQWLYDAGKNLIQGLINGIENMAGSAVSSVENLGSSLLNSVTSFFGIGSPSTVMRDQVGRWLPAGISEGVSANLGPLRAAAERMGATVLAGTRGTLGAGGTGLPLGAAALGAGGTAPLSVAFEGNTDTLLATLIMNLIRTGKIQIKASQILVGR